MLVTTKNTFIDVREPVEPTQPARRERAYSCPLILDGLLTDTDAASTAPSSIVFTHRKFSNEIDACDMPVCHTASGAVVGIAHPQFVSKPIPKSVSDRIKCSGAPHNRIINANPLPDAMSIFQSLHGASDKGNGFVARRGPTSRYKTSCPKTEFEHNNNISIKASKKRGPESSSKIFLGGLNACTVSRDIKQYFINYGDIKDCGVVYDFHGVSRRFAYCEFINPESVVAVLAASPHAIDGTVVGVRTYCIRG